MAGTPTNLRHAAKREECFDGAFRFRPAVVLGTSIFITFAGSV